MNLEALIGLISLVVGTLFTLWRMQNSLRRDIDGKIDKLREEVREVISGEVSKEFEALRTGVDKKLDNLRGEFNNLRTDVDGKLEGLQEKFDKTRDELNESNEKIKTDFHNEIQGIKDVQTALSSRMNQIEQLVERVRTMFKEPSDTTDKNN